MQAIGGAFGAAKAGIPQDWQSFLTRPSVLLRFAGWIFAIVVFGCISAEGWTSDGRCLYNNQSAPCNFGTFVGVTAFLVLMVFLVLDYQFTNLSNVKHRKIAVMVDMGCSGFWTFLWFVLFCVLTDRWRVANNNAELADDIEGVRNNMQAAIAFSFFSILVWGGLTYFAVQRYRQGVQEDFQQGFGDAAQQQAGMADPNAGYTPYSAPGAAGDDYYSQQTPQQQPGGQLPGY